MDFYQKINFNKDSDLRTTVAALVNVVNFLSREMSAGRVPQVQNDVREVKDTYKETLDTNAAYEEALTTLGVLPLEEQEVTDEPTETES